MINLCGDDEALRDRKEPSLDGVVCTFWTTLTGCRKAENCEFLHPAHLAGTAKPKICRFYKERGYCAKEDQCDFLHEGPPGPNMRVCKFFAERGFCAKQEQCNFSHDVQPGTMRSSSSRPKKVCKFFAERGFCAKEDQCDFSHDVAPGSFAPSSGAGQRTCKFYASSGFCAKGDDCDFFHDGPSTGGGGQGGGDGQVCGFWMGGRCEKGGLCNFKHPPRRSPRGFSPEPYGRSERRGRRGQPEDPWDRQGPPTNRYRRGDRRDRRRSPRDRDRREGYSRDYPPSQGDRSHYYDDEPRSQPRSRRDRNSSSMFLDQGERYGRQEPLRMESQRERERPMGGGMKRKWDPRDQEDRPGKRMKTQIREQEQESCVVFAKPRMEIERRTGEDQEKLSKALKRIDLQACLHAVIDACKTCGELIRNKVGEQRQEELTDLDEECNSILASAIARKYPLHGIVARQNAESLPNVPLAPTWFICPLEGRENFVRGSPFVCVSIGLCVQRIPVLGVIYNPILEQIASGFLGGGVYLEEKQTQLYDVQVMEQAIIANEYCRGDLRKRLCGGAKVKGFRETGCFNQDFIDVLRGVCNGGFQENLPGPWSYCAGAALIDEAGGVVTDLQGNLTKLEMNERKLVFGPTKLVEEIVRYF